MTWSSLSRCVGHFQSRCVAVLRFQRLTWVPSYARTRALAQVVASIFKELTEFTRIMVYQFDPNYAGRVVAEVVDWQRTKDLYLNL